MTFSFGLTAGGEGPVSPRAGEITTARGLIHTPAFMPVGTLATVKALSPAEVRGAGWLGSRQITSVSDRVDSLIKMEELIAGPRERTTEHLFQQSH